MSKPGTLTLIDARTVSTSSGTTTVTVRLPKERLFWICGAFAGENADTSPHGSQLVTQFSYDRGSKINLVAGPGPGVPAFAMIGTQGVYPRGWWGSPDAVTKMLERLLTQSQQHLAKMYFLRFFGMAIPPRAGFFVRGGDITVTIVDQRSTPADAYERFSLLALDLGTQRLPGQLDFTNTPHWHSYNSLALTTGSTPNVNIDDSLAIGQGWIPGGGAFVHLALAAKLLITGTGVPATADTLDAIQLSNNGEGSNGHFPYGQVSLADVAGDVAPFFYREIQGSDEQVGHSGRADGINAASTLYLADQFVALGPEYRVFR